MKNKNSAAVSLFFFVIIWAAVSSWALEPQQAPGPKYNALTKEEQNVILLKGTERPFSGKYNYSKAVGTYICRQCNAPLFDSTHKFVNDCGWPCFDDAIKDAVERSANGAKIELQCTNCGGHLGHQFLGEDFTPKNVRNCVNSISLFFVAKGKKLPGVILNNQNGIPKKPKANKNGENANEKAPEVGNQDSTPKASFESLRKKLLEQLNDRDQDVVQRALSILEFDHVAIKSVERDNNSVEHDNNSVEHDDYEEYVPDVEAIGMKLAVKKQLIELLDSASNETQELAIQRLGELGPKADDALPKLRELLANSVNRTKLNAAQAIWQISGNAEESVTALVKLIRDDEKVGPSAVWPFEWMGPAAFSAFEAIEALSKDPRDKVRETATRILSSFGPQYKLSTESPLKARLADRSPEVRIAACLSLLRIGGEREEAVETLIDIVDRVIEKTSATFKDSPEEKLVISAINALGQFQNEAVAAVMPISLHLNAKNLIVRSEAAQALGAIGPGAEKAIPLLAKAMRDTESKAVPLVHFVVNPGDDAAKALGSIGIAAVPILLDSLNDPEVVVRMRAARELGRIPEAAHLTVGPLTAKLSDLNAAVQLEAIKSLARLGKMAKAAAPDLTKFLFATEALTSFPSGSGIGITEPFSAEALRSLRSVEATEEQIVPAILDALDRNQNLTLEAISVLRQYRNRSNEFENPLRRLLDGKNVGAACALAAFGANDTEIQSVLAKNLLEGEQVNSIAALGIGQLVAHGFKLDEAVSAQLSVATKKDYVPMSVLTIMLRLTPDDSSTVASFMAEARIFSAWLDSGSDMENVEETLIELIHHQSVQDVLLQDLDNLSNLIQSRFLSPRILIAANRHSEQAFACLERAAEANTDASAFLVVADFLGKRPPDVPSKSLLIKLLQRNDGCLVGGDFYGNGGQWRYVGDRAALALVRLKEFDTLFMQLDHAAPIVRTRIVSALEASGDQNVIRRLRDEGLE